MDRGELLNVSPVRTRTREPDEVCAQAVDLARRAADEMAGPGAILAPQWVPWRERLRPGDLGAGDILPAPADDERLVPVAALEGDDAVEDLAVMVSQLAGLAESAVSAITAADVPVSRARV